MFSKGALLGLVLAIFAVSFAMGVGAQAQSLDIGMELSATQVSVCPCTPITEIQVKVTNLDDVPHSYKIALEMPKDWTGHPAAGSTIDVTTLEGKKVLDAGESSENMQVYITPSCFTKPGVYTLKAIVTTNGQSNYKSFDVEVLPCHYVQIDSQDSIKTCRAKQTDFTVAVTNFGKVPEEFRIDVSSSWGDTLLSLDNKKLDPNKPEAMEFSITPPELTGTFAIMVDVVSKNSYASNHRSIQFEVQNCYDFNADIKPQSNAVCLGKAAKYTIVIDNVGLQKDTYNIIAPEFATPEKSSITLEPNEEGLVNVFVEPEKLGKNDFEITVVSSSLPAVKSVLSAALDAIECRDVALVTYPTEKTVCQGQAAEYELIIKNTGTVDDMFNIKADIGKLETVAVSLAPNEVKRVKLTIDTSALAPGETRHVNVEARSGEVVDTNVVDVIANNCFSAQFSINPETRNVCVGDEILYELKARNTGKYEEGYSLQMVKEIMDEFTLQPGEEKMLSKTIHAFFPAGNTYDIPFRLVSSHVFEERVMKIAVRPVSECFSVDLRDSEVMEVDSDVGIGRAVLLKLTNKGERRDAYDVSLEGPDWTYLSANQAILEPGATKDFYVYISPTYWVESGTYTVDVKAKSAYAEDNYTFYITVESVFPGMEGEGGNGQPQMIINITLPSAGIIMSQVTADTLKVAILGLIILAIAIILLAKLIMMMK
jgi:uncharacterized membrane protein